MVTNREVPALYFDGQYVDTLWENHDQVINWLEKYFSWQVIRKENWKVDPACRDGKMTQMNFGTWLISYLSDARLPHHYADRNVESNIRLCFRVHQLQDIHRRLSDDGGRVSSLYQGPKTNYFDVWITAEEIRLTLQEDHSVQPGKVAPSWIRVGVSRLDDAISWYEQHMGMKLNERDAEGRYAIMSLRLNHSEGDSLWVLEQTIAEPMGNVDGQVQPICWVQDREQFFKYHQYLQNNGIETSEIGGFLTKGLVGFHFYDQDGNRMNISSM